MQDLFKRFDLDVKETTALLKLIRLGPSPVSVWAKQAGINRSSMYVILERLKSKGLVTTFTHNGIHHAQAIAVSQLPHLLAQKQAQIEDTQAILKHHLPDLEKLEGTHAITPTVRFYEGINRVETMYEEILKERSFCAYFHPSRVKRLMPKYFHKIPQALKANGGTAKELLVACKEAEEYQNLYNSQKHQIKLLPQPITFSSDTIITKTKIYLIGYSENDAVGTEIWNEELAHTQSVIFDLVWSGQVNM